jgi:EpsI family protein
MNIRHTITACIIMLLTLVFHNYISQAEAVPSKTPLSSFPTQIGEWKGSTDRFDDKIYEILGVDDSFLANYFGPDNRLIQLYVGFYGSQREGDIIHSPRNCMPGGGWNITRMTDETLSVGGRKVTVRQLLLEKGKQKQVVLYWFQSRGRIIASEYSQKIYLVWDAIFRNRTDGSFVRLITPVVGGNQKEAEAEIKDFGEKLVPILSEYIPS